MIIMKKKLKVIFASFIIILTILTITLTLIGRTNNYKFLVFKKHYSVLTENKPALEVMLYTNVNENEYLKIDKIENCTVYNSTDFYKVSINQIENIQSERIIKENNYYQYKLHLEFNLELEDRLNIDDAILEVNYKSGEKLKVNVGNICFEKMKTDVILSTDLVQCVCNDIGNLETIGAVKISLKNDYEEEVVIKNIVPISETIFINNNLVKIDEYKKEIDHTVSLSALFDTNYDFYSKSDELFTPIEFKIEDRKDIIIPLTYLEKQFVDHIGFILEIETNGETYFQIVNPYVLFSTSNLDYVTYEYEIIDD